MPRRMTTDQLHAGSHPVPNHRAGCTPSFAGLRPASDAASRAKRACSKKRDTVPELLLRQQLWQMGFRYRKNVNALPGNPDIVFRADRVVVYYDGDFWHGRDWDR